MKILNNQQCLKFIDLSIKRLINYVKESDLRGITTGISGGIDSAVVAVIGLKAGLKFKYYFLDCESDPEDYKKARMLAERFKFTLEKIDLSQWYRQSPLLDFIPKKNLSSNIALGNIKARLRMITLYQMALLNNFIYLDTGDLSEKWIGFWTKHGDEGDVKIIQSLTKTEVYDLGEYLGLPEAILNSFPGDGLGVTRNNLAKEQLGLDYIYIEYIVSRFIGQGFDYNDNLEQLTMTKYVEMIKVVAQEIGKSEESVNKILERSLKTAYKRKHGDYAVNLLPDRSEFGFLKIGSDEFNKKYLKAVKISNHEKNEIIKK